MKRGCTQCGDCLDVCPIFALYRREEYSPKGKRLLMEPLDGWGASETPLPWKTIRRLSRLCAGCGRCARRCARKLSTSELLADLRSQHPHWTQFVWISGFGGLARSGRLPDASPRCLFCRAVRRWKPPAPYCHRRPPRRGDGSSLPCRWGWGRPWLCSPDARRATPAPVGLRGLRRCCGAGAMWFSTAADSPAAVARSTMRGCLRHRPKSGGGTSNAGGIWAAQS